MPESKRAMSIAEIGSKFENFRTPEGEAHGLAYQPEPTDIFIVTPAKCGTTWMQQIVHGLRTRGSMDFDEITRVVPWIEMAKDMGIDIYKPPVANPRAFKTHKNLNDLPKGGKYISVIRDPKDAMLSLYRFFEGWIFEPGSISIEEFALNFYIGTDGRGYWDHIKALWGRRNEQNVLPLCYENMKQDLPAAVERVAEFMEIELDNELKDVVVEQSDFRFMNEHNYKFDDHIVRDTRNEVCGIPADGATSKVKTGKVGEAKLHVSQEVMDEFERVWQEEITSTIGLQSYEELRQVLVN
jgi:aryl sulfotransferase